MATRKKTAKGARKKATRKTPQRRNPPRLESGEGHRGSDMPAYPNYRRKKKRKPWWKRWGGGGGWRGYAKKAVLWMAGLCVAAYFLLSLTLPDIDELNTFKKTPSILIKAENGAIVGSFGDIYGEYIKYSEFPSSLIDAVVATEDRNFYHHFGIDPLGLARAMFVNVRAGHVVQGGSTITQQVAKNVFLTPERNLLRKVKEMMLALKLEARYSKKDILSIYLNRVYLGAGSYGVDAAARRYFDKSARELSLSESAIMAGLLKAPSRYAPTSNPAKSRERALVVLSNMEDAGYLTQAQAAKAKADLNKAMSGRKRHTQSSQYFADWVIDQIPEYVGDIREDLVVITTLDPDRQAMADKAITEVMDKDAAGLNASQAALVSMTPDGAIRAMVGGRSYAESQYNRAAQAFRQPGSSFKLFVFLAGLEAGLHPDSVVEDQPISVKVAGGYWKPKNYTHKYLGEIPLHEAVAQSVNTVAVQVAQQAGFENVVRMARRLGISSDMEPLPSIALGATEVTLLEMTNAYAHLAAEGSIVYPYGIVKILSRRGEVMYEHDETSHSAVLSRGVVGQMNEMLKGVIAEGTGRGAQIGRDAAGKTGTTSDYRDAWFMGYTPALVTGVWVGNDDNTPMKKVTGGMLPARIWRQYMSAALAGVPAESLPTGGGGWFDAGPPQGQFLPWQDGGPPGELPESEEDQVGKRPRKQLELGPSFWDKLLR